MKPSYPYAVGDRLEDRNTYFYTPFCGREFLTAWRRHREDARRSLVPSQDAAPAPQTKAVPVPKKRKTGHRVS